MALSIKDPEADRLVRELAAATGESITEAARRAFAERLERVRARTASAATVRLDDIIARARTLPVTDSRTPDEIIGYDENGLPA
ncbi:type II toxin-antitoxin system VapB family antitoxin [Microbacterium sp. BWT-B31]|uniref:type II toxin-antitoxin system VapB family antitoxin n=1 Tax=Microbacterium sp. BWT-B31 TaxID=3232072 RepID=UPI003528612B